MAELREPLRLRVPLAVGEVRVDAVPHTYRVESERARWLVTTTRGDFERFMRAVSRPAERAELPEPAPPPSPERAEALAATSRADNIEFVGPPLA